jgi:hypothetical protein
MSIADYAGYAAGGALARSLRVAELLAQARRPLRFVCWYFEQQDEHRVWFSSLLGFAMHHDRTTISRRVCGVCFLQVVFNNARKGRRELCRRASTRSVADHTTARRDSVIDNVASYCIDNGDKRADFSIAYRHRAICIHSHHRKKRHRIYLGPDCAQFVCGVRSRH